MSTATLDTPVTAATTAAELPDMTGAFADAMKQLEAKESGAPAPQAKPPVKEPAAKVTETKAPETKAEVKAEAPVARKPKSALDAALSDDAPTEVVEQPVDEVAKLIESKDPNWDKARETMKTQSVRIKEYEAKLAKPELPADVTSQLAQAKEMKSQMEKLLAEKAKLEDSVLALDVRFHPATQEKIQLRDNGVTKLSATIKEAGADSAAFEEAMALPLTKRGKYLDAILEGIESPRTRATVERKLAEIEVMDEQLDEQLSKPHKSFEEMKQQRVLAEQQHAAEVERFKDATFESVKRELPKLSKLMRPAPADAEGAKEYNETLQADLAKAPSLLEVEPEQAAQAAYMAARYPTIEKLYVESRAEIAQLREYVAKLEGSEPGFRGNGKAPVKADYEKPLGDAFLEAMNAQRGI